MYAEVCICIHIIGRVCIFFFLYNFVCTLKYVYIHIIGRVCTFFFFFTKQVCTDIAARGLDMPDVDHVIMFDFPLNPIDYLHRSGTYCRTAVRLSVGRWIAPPHPSPPVLVLSDPPRPPSVRPSVACKRQPTCWSILYFIGTSYLYSHTLYKLISHRLRLVVALARVW